MSPENERTEEEFCKSATIHSPLSKVENPAAVIVSPALEEFSEKMRLNDQSDNQSETKENL